MLSDVELPMIDGDGGDYLDSLRKIDALVAAGAVETLVPGHGHVTRGADAIRARIAEDVDYVERLRSVVGAKLGGGEEVAVEACHSISYRGKDGWPPMGKVHEDNARAVYRSMRQHIENR